MVSPVDDAVACVTVRPVIENNVALELPPTSATGTLSVITPGPPIVKLPWILCAPGYVRNLPWVVLMDEVSPSKKLGA